MKKLCLLVLASLFIISCSKTKINGKINGGSPLERIEFIEASGVATLPLINLGVNEKGEFKGEFNAPKSGLYAMTYGGQMSFVYVKKGQTLNIIGDAGTFPTVYRVEGDAKANNDFIKETQNFMETYLSKFDMNLLAKDEKAFLVDIKKINVDLNKNLDDATAKNKPDSEVIQLKKDELATNILTFLVQYESTHGQAVNNPNFKVSKEFLDYQKTFEANNDRMVKELPTYRNYLLNKIGRDFQKFAQEKSDNKASMSSMFAKFLDTKKELSQDTKDYLLAFVIAKFDLNPSTENIADLKKVAEANIKNTEVKKDLNNAFDAVFGLAKGTEAPNSSLVKADGKSASIADFKGKPTLVMTYASWNPYIAQSTIPVLKEVFNFYKSKTNFVFVNLDDTKEQFTKTSNSMMKGIAGTNLYAEGGLGSKFAKDYFIYGFKVPGFLVLDKDGKVAGPTFYNLGDEKLIELLNKLTGLSAPTAAPAQLTPELMQQMQQAEPHAAK